MQNGVTIFEGIGTRAHLKCSYPENVNQFLESSSSSVLDSGHALGWCFISDSLVEFKWMAHFEL